ncbi:hypothetical protein [Ralstonia phage RP13]|nr:hypothetical protein [Ralstonia phage RP13]
MIDKLISQLTSDIIDFCNTYNIKLEAQYTPDLPGVLTYSRNFLSRTLAASPVSLDGKLYQNKLLYRVDTPKPAEYAPHNNPFTVVSGYEKVSQNYSMSFDTSTNTISKVRVAPTGDDGLVRARDLSILQIPVEFTVITENLDLVFALSSLFYQQIVHLNILSVDLDLFGDGNKSTLPYFMNWDRDSLEVGYANFENSSALNTLSFKLVLSGAVFSEFFFEDHVINRYDLTIGSIRSDL